MQAKKLDDQERNHRRAHHDSCRQTRPKRAEARKRVREAVGTPDETLGLSDLHASLGWKSGAADGYKHDPRSSVVKKSLGSRAFDPK